MRNRAPTFIFRVAGLIKPHAFFIHDEKLFKRLIKDFNLYMKSEGTVKA